MRFHIALLEPSSLKRSIKIIKNKYVGMAQIIHFRLVNYLDQNSELAWAHAEEHRAILKAEKDKDINAALDLLENHITKASKRLKKLFAQSNQNLS